MLKPCLKCFAKSLLTVKHLQVHTPAFWSRPHAKLWTRRFSDQDWSSITAPFSSFLWPATAVKGVDQPNPTSASSSFKSWQVAPHGFAWTKVRSRFNLAKVEIGVSVWEWQWVALTSNISGWYITFMVVEDCAFACFFRCPGTLDHI